jgi:ribosomal protein L1
MTMTIRPSSSLWSLAHSRDVEERKYEAKEAFELLRQESKKGESSFLVRIELNTQMPGLSRKLVRGFFDLPHGSGEKHTIAAVTTIPELAAEAKEIGGAHYSYLYNDFRFDLTTYEIQPSSFMRLVASKELKKILTPSRDRETRLQKAEKGSPDHLVRILSKFHKLPKQRDGTIVDPDEFVETVRKHAQGYRTKLNMPTSGSIITPIGRMKTHRLSQLLDNLEYVIQHLFAIKPSTPSDPHMPYILRIYVSLENSIPGLLELDLDSTLQTMGTFNSCITRHHA